jgi:hypothetical protein
MPDTSIAETKPSSTNEGMSKRFNFSDAILQTLDREVGGYYLTSMPYEEAIGKWKGIPLVYAKEHPDPKLFATDPEAALKKVKGKIVGEVVNAWVERTGHPRAMAQFAFSDDNILKLKEAGKLSHSTSFSARLDGKKVMGEVLPNHVLVFEEGPDDMPKDHGAFILNKQDKCPQVICNKVKELPFAGFTDWEDCMAKQSEKYDEETAKKVCGKLKAKFEGKTPTTEEVDAEMKEILTATSKEEDKMTKELEQKIEILNKETAEKDSKIKELQQKVEEFEKDKADREWVSMKGKLPVGMIHKPEDEAALRKEWDENPKAFAYRILDMKQPEIPKKEGTEVVDEQVEFKKLDSKWKSGGGF